MIDKTSMDVSEVVETLTGYEERNIEQRFGAIIGDLLEERPTSGLRALVMVLVARDLVAQDVKNPQGKAFEHVMGMTLKQVDDFFPEYVEPEVDPEQPETEAGKGGTDGPGEPGNSPLGA